MAYSNCKHIFYYMNYTYAKSNSSIFGKIDWSSCIETWDVLKHMRAQRFEPFHQFFITLLLPKVSYLNQSTKFHLVHRLSNCAVTISSRLEQVRCSCGFHVQIRAIDTPEKNPHNCRTNFEIIFFLITPLQFFYTHGITNIIKNYSSISGLLQKWR